MTELFWWFIAGVVIVTVYNDVAKIDFNPKNGKEFFAFLLFEGFKALWWPIFFTRLVIIFVKKLMK